MNRLNLLGAGVAKLRFERNWTQEILVARLQCLGVDITRQKLANMECGRSEIPATLLPKLQEVFAVRLAMFFSRAVQELDEQLAQRDQRMNQPGHRPTRPTR
jgi:transcriptional regulator with XRE-family HTH domain